MMITSAELKGDIISVQGTTFAYQVACRHVCPVDCHFVIIYLTIAAA